MTTRIAIWRKWFDSAKAEMAGGDLAFLADEAPDAAAAREARTAAVIALLSSGSIALADEQIAKLLSDTNARAIARELQASRHELTPAGPGTLPSAFVFSGHMLDGPRRRTPRFPSTSVGIVAAEIRTSLVALGGGPGGLAVSSAASGGDLLFLEAALDLGMRATICLPFGEKRFLRSSVSLAGDEWTDRYRRLTAEPSVTLKVPPLAAPAGSNPYARCNRWLLYTALAAGPRQLRGIVVWDGRPGDGPGGTSHLMDELGRRGVPVQVVDPLRRAV